MQFLISVDVLNTIASTYEEINSCFLIIPRTLEFILYNNLLFYIII